MGLWDSFTQTFWRAPSSESRNRFSSFSMRYNSSNGIVSKNCRNWNLSDRVRVCLAVLASARMPATKNGFQTNKLWSCRPWGINCELVRSGNTILVNAADPYRSSGKFRWSCSRWWRHDFVCVPELRLYVDNVDTPHISSIRLSKGSEWVWRFSQVPPAIPGVGPWLSTEFVPGNSCKLSSISNFSHWPCCCCHNQKYRSMLAWWMWKMGSRPAVSFSPISPLAPETWLISPCPGTSNPPTAKCMSLCGLSSGITWSWTSCRSFHYKYKISSLVTPSTREIKSRI